MKKIVSYLLILLCLMFLVTPVQAAYIDLRPDGLILPSDGDNYDPGDIDLSLEVWIMPDTGDTVLNNYTFDISYDDSESIIYTGGTSTSPYWLVCNEC